MGRYGEFRCFDRGRYEKHKGFYNDRDPEQHLSEICYADFFEKPDDENFAYDDAGALLRGACHLFALSLARFLGYNAYLIEAKGGGLHAFCQVYRDNQLYYIDARGATTSFDEFMEVAGYFAAGEFCVREITVQDIEEWENTESYYEEALLFAETVIKEYEQCYRV